MTPIAINFILPNGDYTSRPVVNDEDSAHFLATFNRATRLSEGENVEACDVHMGQRTEDRYVESGVKGAKVLHTKGGWLEHTIVVRYVGGRTMVVGAIQRSVGVSSEFHS